MNNKYDKQVTLTRSPWLNMNGEPYSEDEKIMLDALKKKNEKLGIKEPIIIDKKIIDIRSDK